MILRHGSSPAQKKGIRPSNRTSLAARSGIGPSLEGTLSAWRNLRPVPLFALGVRRVVGILTLGSSYSPRPSHPPRTVAILAAFVTDHSGGAVLDLHQLPSFPIGNVL
jgi:hypothetical protein